MVAPISFARADKVSIVLTLCPSTSDMESAVMPIVACTWDMEDSKSAAVFTAAVPAATRGTVTDVVSFVPTPEILSPTDCSLVPTSSIFARVVLVVAAWVSKDFSFSSVSTISRWSASYCSWEISPLASCSLADSAAVFKVSSFSFVSLMASVRSLCFCASSSVLDGSSFRSFSTSFNWDCVFLISVFTSFRADCRPVVEPSISTVIPLSDLAAMCSHLP